MFACNLQTCLNQSLAWELKEVKIVKKKTSLGLQNLNEMTDLRSYKTWTL